MVGLITKIYTRRTVDVFNYLDFLKMKKYIFSADHFGVKGFYRVPLPKPQSINSRNFPIQSKSNRPESKA